MTPPASDADREGIAALLDRWEQELRALVEIRCERHGRDVPAPSFAVVLTSLAILEAVLTIFEWKRSAPKTDQLVRDWIDKRTQLGDDYATRLWDTYRNGLAHLFAPKQKGGLVNIVRWAEDDARPCTDGPRQAEFFQVSVQLRPGRGLPPGHFTMHAAELAKAVVDTISEKRAVLTARGFDSSRMPGWAAWQKQRVGARR